MAPGFEGWQHPHVLEEVDPQSIINAARSITNVNIVTASGSAVTLPATSIAPVNDVKLTAPCTITFPVATAGVGFTLLLRQDATGGRVATWPAVKWPGGAAPTITPAPNSVDVIQFICVDGVNWLGFPAGYDVR